MSNDYAGFIYEWTNTVNGMKYLGGHTGQDDDGYIGGGKKFRDALRTYGLLNFKRTIIEYVKDSKKIKDRENYYLDLYNAAESDDYYNTARRSSGLRAKKKSTQADRKICPTCNQRPCAVNYTKDGITHYRSHCDSCLKRGKDLKKPVPRWQAAGYKKKPACDKCGFRARYSAQLLVYHVDGNLHNSDVKNLKTVCLNCIEEIKRSDLPWKQGDLEPDF